MDSRPLVVLTSLALVGAVDLHKVATLEEQHQRPFWHLGEGFEGSASDWTEYVVWLVGVIGVLYYMFNPNMRRNLYAEDDEQSSYAQMIHDAEDEPEVELTEKKKE